MILPLIACWRSQETIPRDEWSFRLSRNQNRSHWQTVAAANPVLTIDTIFRLLSHWHFVLRQCRQDFGGVAGLALRASRNRIHNHSRSGDQDADTLPLLVVHFEEGDRHPSNRRLPTDERAVRSKMFCPLVPPRMEEPHDSVRPWLDAGEVGTFDQIAIGTGQGQVLRVVSAAMLPRDNVLNVKAQF